MNKEQLKEIAYIAWQGAANAFRLYPDNKHTFVEYWTGAESMFDKYITDESLPGSVTKPKVVDFMPTLDDCSKAAAASPSLWAYAQALERHIESLTGSAGMREALEGIGDIIKNDEQTNRDQLVMIYDIVTQALSSTGEEKCEEPKMDDYCIWVRDQIKDLEKIDGEVMRVREVHRGAISLKFKSGHSYYISINKATAVTID